MSKPILYSTGCPQCNVLTAKLDQNNIQYDVVSDEQEIMAKGFRSVPMLEVDGEALDFIHAIAWVRKQ